MANRSQSLQPAVADTSPDEPYRSLEETDDEVIITATDADFDRLESTTAVSCNRVDESQAVLESNSHTGMITLSDGRTIHLEPKLPQLNLLYLLQFIEEVDADIGTDVATVDGTGTAVDLLAMVYLEELRPILTNGLARSYEQTQETEEYIRGTFQLHDQLQRHGPAAARFECEYSELTTDTVLNQAVLYAGWLLQSAVSLATLQTDLRRVTDRLRRQVTLQPVSVSALDAITLSRLDSGYRSLYQIVRTVLTHARINDLAPGTAPASVFTISTAHRFEAAVHTALERCATREANWDVNPRDSEYQFDPFITGDQSFTPQIESVLYIDGEPAIGIDAKYKDLSKTGTDGLSVASSDWHQIASYANHASMPILLVYPEFDPDQTVDERFDLYSGIPLGLTTIPTATEYETLEAYSEALTDGLYQAVADLLSLRD